MKQFGKTTKPMNTAAAAKPALVVCFCTALPQ
jgi:hypothetical protein